MALPVAFLESVTDEKNMKGLVDNIWDDSFFGLRMMNRNSIKYQDGDKFTQGIEYAKAKKGGAYGKYDSKQFAVREFATRIEMERRFYSEDIILYDRDVDANKGQAQLIDLVTETVRSAYDCLKDSIFVDMFRLDATDSDPDSIKVYSLEDLFNQTAGTTYCGISASEFSGWVANIDTTTTLSTMTQKLYKDSLRDAIKGRGRKDRPTIGITTQTIWNKVEDNEIDKDRGAYQKELELGKNSILVDGVPLIVDTFQNEGYLDWINEDYYHMYIHSADNFTREPWMTSEEKHATLSGVTLTANLGCTRRDVHSRMNALV